MAREMKDSGIEWIGNIPAEWAIVSIGRLFQITAGGDAKPEFYSDTQDTEHPFPVFTNSMNKDQVYAYTSKPLFEKDTITVTGRGTIGTAFYRQIPYDAIIRLLSLSPKLDLDGRFYAYWINNVIHFFTDSAAVGQLSSIQMASYKTVYCTKQEQFKIADFLDRECSRINAVIEQTRASIEEYKKLKQAVITQAVTKGIRPNRPMKDSGIEWIGEIPFEWNTISIGRLFSISAGGDAKPEFYSDVQDEEHPYPVYTNSMSKNQVYAYTSKPIFEKGTVTVTGRGAIGTAFYRETPYDAIIRLLSLRPKLDLDGRFYAYWISNVIHFFTDSAAVGQLSAIQMASYKTIYCQKEEQSVIADYLDAECSKIDILISKKELLLSEIELYKKSLIYEYVTGKKEVPA